MHERYWHVLRCHREPNIISLHLTSPCSILINRFVYCHLIMDLQFLGNQIVGVVVVQVKAASYKLE